CTWATVWFSSTWIRAQEISAYSAFCTPSGVVKTGWAKSKLSPCHRYTAMILYASELGTSTPLVVSGVPKSITADALVWLPVTLLAWTRTCPTWFSLIGPAGSACTLTEIARTSALAGGVMVSEAEEMLMGMACGGAQGAGVSIAVIWSRKTSLA